jgi:hypothetical protein
VLMPLLMLFSPVCIGSWWRYAAFLWDHSLYVQNAYSVGYAASESNRVARMLRQQSPLSPNDIQVSHIDMIRVISNVNLDFSGRSLSLFHSSLKR